MITEIGHFALVLALVLSIAQASLPLIGAERGIRAWMALAKPAALGQFAFLLIAYAALIHAFVVSDFSVAVVYLHSHSETPLIYKIAAAWGQHEGSLLLWVLILAFFGALVAFFGDNLPPRLKARTLAVQAMIGTAFMLFALFTSNPFARLSPAPLEGQELNPLLQDPGLAFHPPTLYLGYVGLSVVFSFAVGALVTRQVNARFARAMRPWVLIAWVLLLVGYGTKMGLAPMHTWKPEAYGEAPGIVGALLAGGVTTVAFTAILRVRAVVGAAGSGPVADRTLLVIGLFSMVVAAVFLLATRDFKRMLGYSSVEHMGILAIAASFGMAGVAVALFHVWSNSLTKGALFLSAANIRRAAGSASIDEVRGAGVLTPRSAGLFVAGLFAVTATPPFGPFFSELGVVRVAFEGGHTTAMAIFLCCLLLAFIGMSRVVFAVVDGRPRAATRAIAARFVESRGAILPPLVLLVLSLWLGLFTPPLLQQAWSDAASQLVPAPTILAPSAPTP